MGNDGVLRDGLGKAIGLWETDSVVRKILMFSMLSMILRGVLLSAPS